MSRVAASTRPTSSPAALSRSSQIMSPTSTSGRAWRAIRPRRTARGNCRGVAVDMSGIGPLRYDASS